MLVKKRDAQLSFDKLISGLAGEFKTALLGFYGAVRAATASGPSNLPAPNDDISLRAPVALDSSAIVHDLGWRDCNYLPIAEVNDGDLLMISMANSERPVVAYYHDGAEFYVIYANLADALAAIR